MNNAEKAMKRLEEEAEKLLQKNNNCKLNLDLNTYLQWSSTRLMEPSQETNPRR